MSKTVETEHGTKGQMIYDRVEALTATGMIKSQAIDALAQELGMKTGTVAANYYRIARQNGDTTTRASRAKNGEFTAVLDTVADSLTDAVERLNALREKYADIEEQLARLRHIERLLNA